MKYKGRFINNFHGIRRRWMLNGVLLILFLAVIGISAFSVSIYNYYYNSLRTSLVAKVQTATAFFANYITKTATEYYPNIYKYTVDFEESKKLELQFISEDGKVETSSYGLTAGSTPGTPDIGEALSSKTISIWYGEDPATGERIMAVSAPMLYSDNQVVGVMRYVTSLKLVDKQITQSILSAVGVALALLLLTLFINMYYIRSVVAPINEITMIAKRIAEGSYGVRIGKKYNDEIGEMVDSINEMSMKIAQSEKTQTEFISSVSHELRTPLTAITGWGETLLYDENLDAEARRGIDIILKEARRLTTMVEELLEFTRMQDGRFTLNVEKIDIGAELEDSIFTYREILRLEEIDLEYEPYQGELPLINGDPERLKQVFLNILDNAAKYGKSGKKIVVGISADNSYVTITIRDFGPGVPEDDLEHVKMKFYKGTSKERGSGIGLAVCDEIIKYHDGQLKLRNAEGGGLIVTVRLPITK